MTNGAHNQLTGLESEPYKVAYLSGGHHNAHHAVRAALVKLVERNVVSAHEGEFSISQARAGAAVSSSLEQAVLQACAKGSDLDEICNDPTVNNILEDIDRELVQEEFLYPEDHRKPRECMRACIFMSTSFLLVLAIVSCLTNVPPFACWQWWVVFFLTAVPGCTAMAFFLKGRPPRGEQALEDLRNSHAQFKGSVGGPQAPEGGDPALMYALFQNLAFSSDASPKWVELHKAFDADDKERAEDDRVV